MRSPKGGEVLMAEAGSLRVEKPTLASIPGFGFDASIIF